MNLTIALLAGLFTAQFASALESQKPEVVALTFHADACGSCKVLDPKMQAVKSEFAGDPILFITLDHSTKDTGKQAAMLADSLGLADLYSAQNKASGYVLLVNSSDKTIIGKLTKGMSEDEIRTTLKNAIKG